MDRNIFHIESEEKKRILLLHETSTKKQYLIREEPSNLTYGTPNVATPSSGVKLDFKSVEEVENMKTMLGPGLYELMKIRAKCQNSQYTGSVDESKVNEKLDYFVDNFWNRYSWFSNKELEAVSDNIKSLGNMPTFCKLNERFKSQNSRKSDLLIRFHKSVMNSDSLYKYLINPLMDLEKGITASDFINSSFNKIMNKDINPDPVPDKKPSLLDPILKKHNEMLSKKTGENEWRSLSPSYDKQILQALGKNEDRRLTNDDIKDIYIKLKNSNKL